MWLSVLSMFVIWTFGFAVGYSIRRHKDFHIYAQLIQRGHKTCEVCCCLLAIGSIRTHDGHWLCATHKHVYEKQPVDPALSWR